MLILIQLIGSTARQIYKQNMFIYMGRFMHRPSLGSVSRLRY